jgi:hypothetical protein
VDGPRLIEWAQHALAKAERERFVPSDVEDVLLDHHHERQAKPRRGRLAADGRAAGDRL